MKTLLKTLLVFTAVLVHLGVMAGFIGLAAWMEGAHPEVCGPILIGIVLIALFGLIYCLVRWAEERGGIW